MSTNLQLCQSLRQECTDTGSGPSAVTGQTGELARFVQWIVQAWNELQQESELWRWMRKSFAVNTVASTGEYAYGACTDTVSAVAITRWARWYRNTFKCYLASAGVGSEYPLLWMEWDDFRRLYRYGTQNNGQPQRFSIDPSGRICLGPKPNDVYVVSGDYQIGPQTLAADGDIPEMPTRFHQLIVYEAMSKYGGNRVAPEAILRANAEGGKLRAALELDQLPRWTYGEPLA